MSKCYYGHEIFPNVQMQGTNAKETTVNLERNGRFKTWTFRSIDGSLTGATRCNKFLTADDLVSGIEEDKLKQFGNQPPTRDKKKSSSVDFPQPGGTLNANMSNLSSIKSCND